VVNDVLIDIEVWLGRGSDYGVAVCLIVPSVVLL